MKKFLVAALVITYVFVFALPQAQAATRHKKGSVVVDKNRAVYYLGESVRYPFPSMEVFKSWGHAQKSIVKANDGDLAMPVGPVAVLNYRPVGHVDEVTPEGKIRGWVMDRNHLNATNYTIGVTFDSPKNTSGVSPYKNNSGSHGIIGLPRPDVNAALGVTGNFGFEIDVMEGFDDGLPHTVYITAFDPEYPESWVLLSGSPFTFTFNSALAIKPTITFFNAGGKSVITAGEPVTLGWSTDNATSGVTIDGIAVDWFGSKVVYPTVKTTYTLAASNSAGTVTKKFTIDVVSPASLRDEKRIEDFFMIAISLVYYATENGDKFPDSLQSILDTVPTAPAGAEYPCNGSNNDYVYTPSADRINFTFRYCLEMDWPDYFVDPAFGKAGVHTMDYQAQKANTEAMAADAKRLSDTTQIRVALELFYDKHSRYPVSLSGMPSAVDGNSTDNFYAFLSNFPTSPIPPGGSCTESQNVYWYTQTDNGQSYSLTFCLAKANGGYTAGVHTATPNGIQ